MLIADRQTLAGVYPYMLWTTPGNQVDQGHAHSWQTNTGWALPLHVVVHTRESGDQGHAHNWQTTTGWGLPLHVVDHTRESGDQCHAHSWQTNTGWALPLHVVDHTRESGDQCHAHSWQTNTGWALPLHVVDHTRESGDQGHVHSWQTKAMLIADRHTLARLYPWLGDQGYALTDKHWLGPYMLWPTPGNPHQGIRRPRLCS